MYNPNGTISSAIPADHRRAVDFINEYRVLGGKTYLLYLPHWYWEGNLGPGFAGFTYRSGHAARLVRLHHVQRRRPLAGLLDG